MNINAQVASGGKVPSKTTVTSEGARVPDFSAQPVTKPWAPSARPLSGTHHTQATKVSGKKTIEKRGRIGKLLSVI